jgi:parvulin-like peptidyl-prolyl isomerase
MRVFVLIVTALVVLTRCSTSTTEPSSASTNLRSDAPLPFEQWVTLASGLAPKELDPAARGTFYREYVAERLFAAEAQRQQLEPSETELAAALEALSDIPISLDATQRQALARQRVLAILFEEKVIRPAAHPTAQEVDARVAATAKQAPPVVTFRMLRADSRSAIEQLRQRLRNRESFDDVAASGSTAPDRGALQRRELAQLPAQAAAVLEHLPEGQISEPVEIAGAWYLFLLEARLRQPDPGRSDQRQTTLRQLENEKFSRQRELMLGQLAQAAGLKLDEELR